MNFYSDLITNDIIDNTPIENILDSLEYFQLSCQYSLLYYSLGIIHHKYTTGLLENPKNILAFYCINMEFDTEDCPSLLVYRKYSCKNEIKYYILFACTKRSFRGLGYASKLIDGLIIRIKKENKTEKTNKIIASSLDTSIIFYEKYGFKLSDDEITQHPVLMQSEKYEKDKKYFIYEYDVK